MLLGRGAMRVMRHAGHTPYHGHPSTPYGIPEAPEIPDTIICFLTTSIDSIEVVKDVTYFIIVVQAENGKTWTVKQRYEAFRNLHKQLQSDCYCYTGDNANDY